MTPQTVCALLAVYLLSACSSKSKGTEELAEGGAQDGAVSDGATGRGFDRDGAPVDDAGAGHLDGSTDGDGGNGGGTILTGDAGPFAVNDAGQVLCGTAPCACSDGVDQDADGLIDLADPECVSAWDNDEATLATGIPGDNRDNACQDCFFDGNSGSGDDGCRRPSSCLTTGLPSGQSNNCSSCEVSTSCRNFCQAYTPNGCDCFGCCSVKLANGTVANVHLAPGCNVDGNDVTGCTQCVPSTSCVNTCGRCELCPGKTLADLPADCASTSIPGGDGGMDPGEITPSCDNGEARCGAGLPSCAVGSSCSFGCCVLTPIILF